MKVSIAMALLHIALASLAVAGEQSPLGSPAASTEEFSRDYTGQVRAAMPPIGATELRGRLHQVVVQAAQDPPLAIDGLASLERFFGLPVRAPREHRGVFQSGDSAYLYDATLNRFVLAESHPDAAPIPRSQFAQQLPLIQRAHAELAGRLGLGPASVMAVDFGEILSQGNQHPRSGNRATEIFAEGATSTYVRGIAGILVDGSRARISSRDADTIESVDVVWPHVVLPANVERARPPSDLVRTVSKRVADHAAGLAVNVRMAVVLRPVLGNGLVYVPALRVRVKPESIRDDDGFRVDAGETFYVNLVSGRYRELERGPADAGLSMR